jgi:putative membrane protein
MGMVASLYALAVLLVPGKSVAWVFNARFPIESVLSIAVGLMLSIRVAQAYDRWWEGRIQWGKLVNVSRNLAIKVKTLGKPDAEEAAQLHRLIGGFPHALKNHLRGGAQLGEVPGFEDSTEEVEHVPVHLVGRLYALVDGWVAKARIRDLQALIIDAEARELLEVAGACERIRNTPPPASFVAVVRFGMLLLVATLPWELVDEIGWWALPATALTTFLVCSAESVAREIEVPFGLSTDHLDLEGICEGISRVTGTVLGVKSDAPN